MKISSTWNFRSIVGKILMGLVLSAMLGSAGVVPALGDDDHDRRGRHDNRRYEHRERGHDNWRYEHRERGYDYYQPYGYRERIYAPIYAPAPAPGVSIFFPIHR